MVVVGYLVAAVALFAWFYPVYTAETISRSQWQLRMWFDCWT